jgi:hypothetical protein
MVFVSVCALPNIAGAQSKAGALDCPTYWPSVAIAGNCSCISGIPAIHGHKKSRIAAARRKMLPHCRHFRHPMAVIVCLVKEDSGLRNLGLQLHNVGCLHLGIFYGWIIVLARMLAARAVTASVDRS